MKLGTVKAYGLIVTLLCSMVMGVGIVPVKAQEIHTATRSTLASANSSNLHVGVTSITTNTLQNTYQYLVYGDRLFMTYGGPWWDYCHHVVHFSYPRSLDGRIVGFAVFGPGNPSSWGSPGNGQLNAGYRYVPGPGLECVPDFTNRPGDFKLWLSIRS